jgi:hypothetical protein
MRHKAAALLTLGIVAHITPETNIHIMTMSQAMAAPSGCISPITTLSVSPDGKRAAYFTFCTFNPEGRRHGWLVSTKISPSGKPSFTSIDNNSPTMVGFVDSNHILYITTSGDRSRPDGSGLTIRSIDLTNNSDIAIKTVHLDTPVYGVTIRRGRDSYLISAQSLSPRLQYLFVMNKTGDVTEPFFLRSSIPLHWDAIKQAYIISFRDGNDEKYPTTIGLIGLDGKLRQSELAPPILVHHSIYGARISQSINSSYFLLTYQGGNNPPDTSTNSAKVMDTSADNFVLHSSIPWTNSRWVVNAAVSDDGQLIALKYPEYLEIRELQSLRLLQSIRLSGIETEAEMSFSPDEKKLILGANGAFIIHDMQIRK